MKFAQVVILSAIALVSACGTNTDANRYTTAATVGETGQGSADEGQSTTAAGSSEDTGDGDGDGDGGPLLDVFGGSADGNESSGEEGCEKVDFLFVIDNSGSMTEEQMALVTSFPGFISTISDTLMAQDYHLMVTDTDAASVGSSSVGIFNGDVTCEPHPTCCQGACNGIGGVVIQPPPAECNGEPCENFPLPTGCDVEIGAGKNKGQEGESCGIDGGLRYMLDSQQDLEGTFGCAALVGAGGDGLERPMDAMMEAISSQSDPGGCNEGFLRDDAVLVVVVISDEDDVDQSMGDPASWKQFLVDHKGGNEEAIVVLGLLADGGVMGGQCEPDDDAPALRSFAESFTHGQVESVCAPDYAPFFDAAVAEIDTACDEFTPVE
ncbi:hypothetical protein ENSA5_08680 [Enhygromyxa salina]|uniref:VWFA domain-containing protein n=1 Tax=Enhygromyxa salina TaxID=215803 RepID=A0A2S9YGY9_9BACT|nr:hypothetical protein [Enhygromyxa salina]PRQ04302.1 hypothetical protein ENSA5_08680 [Enhygromyxa salina]